jgi:hypothetical protein
MLQLRPYCRLTLGKKMPEALNNDFEQLYQTIIAKVESVLTEPQDKALKRSILININEIRSWLPEKNSPYDASNRLHKAALNALKTSFIILNAIAALANQHQYEAPQSLGSKTLMHHLFSGAHILLEDNGRFVDELEKAADLFKRYSSHYKHEKIQQFIERNPERKNNATFEQEALADFYSGTPDRSLRAEVIFNELVMGRVTKNGKTYSWLQFEGHSHQPRSAYKNQSTQLLDNIVQLLGYSLEKFQHHLDFVQYIWHKKQQNIGQYGYSFFSEAKPLILQKSNVARYSDPLYRDPESLAARLQRNPESLQQHLILNKKMNSIEHPEQALTGEKTQRAPEHR